MAVPTLKKFLGEAGGQQSDDLGGDRLYDLLLALVKQGQTVVATNASTITTGVKATTIALFDGALGNISVRAGTGGSAGATVVSVIKNGVTLATTISSDNALADGAVVQGDLSADPLAAVTKGDIIQISVTTAPTAGANLDVALQIRPALIQS